MNGSGISSSFAHNPMYRLSALLGKKTDIRILFLMSTIMNGERENTVVFFDKIILRDKKISSVRYTKAVQTLLDNRLVIITSDWLPLQDALTTFDWGSLSVDVTVVKHLLGLSYA